MDEDDDMEFRHHEEASILGPPRRPGGDPPGPLAEDHQNPLEDAHQVDPLEADHRAGRTPWTGRTRRSPPGGPPGDPDDPPGNGDPDTTWRWIVYLRRRVFALECEVDTGKVEMARISGVAARAQKDLDIARAETKSLTNVVSGLQERLDALEARGSVGRDRPPWSLARRTTAGDRARSRQTPRPRRSPQGSPQRQCPLSHRPSHHSAGRRNERVPPGSGSEEWRDEWLSADYHNRRAPPRTPVRPASTSPGTNPQAGGRYGGLRDEVPRGEWSGMSAKVRTWTWTLGLEEPRGVRREAAERSRRRRDEDAYMDAVRREHFCSAYVEEPRRSHRGLHGGDGRGGRGSP